MNYKIRDPPSAGSDYGDIFREPSKVISVHVGMKGDPKVVFKLHEHVLRHCSTLFSKALDGAFTEGSTQEFESFEDDPAIFGLLVEYLYKDSIRTSGGKAPTMEQYFKLWIMGDFLGFVEVQNYCAWCLVTGYDDGKAIAPENLAELFDAAPKLESTPMHRFLVDIIVWTDLDTELLGCIGPEMSIMVIGNLKAKCKGDIKSPLLDVRNYYVEAAPEEPLPDDFPPEPLPDDIAFDPPE